MPEEIEVVSKTFEHKSKTNLTLCEFFCVLTGGAGEHPINLLPWKIPFPTSPPITYPTESILSKGITSVNRGCDAEYSAKPQQVSLNQEPQCLQNSSGPLWTKETVDAAVALTSMASLNAARRNLESPRPINK